MTDAAGPLLRIVEVEAFGRGGLAHYVNNLSCALAERGHRVTLVTARQYELDGQTGLPPTLQLEKRTARFTSPHRDRPAGILLRIARRFEAVADAFAVAVRARRLRPDVLHLHSTNSIALLYLFLFRWLKARVVFTAHVVTPHEPIVFEGPIYRGMYRLADLIVAHSRFDRLRLEAEFGVASGRIVVIPHGEYGFFLRAGRPPDRQAARAELGLEPEGEVALFFGYIREYKGLDVLLEAWPRVVTERPSARLLIAGNPAQLGPDRTAAIEAWATRIGALHRLEYIPLEEVTRYLVAADALVMPYRRISQSGVLFLALALGLPIVATRVGGLPELLVDGETAVLVDPESPRQLSEGLLRMLGDAELRARLSNASRRLAAEHSWDAIAHRTEQAFVELCLPPRPE